MAEFRRQSDYKLAWQGGWLMAVSPQNTSRTCLTCGQVSAENRQAQAQFCCAECGFKENVDVVDAINILARGHRVRLVEREARSGRLYLAGTLRERFNPARCRIERRRNHSGR